VFNVIYELYRRFEDQVGNLLERKPAEEHPTKSTPVANISVDDQLVIVPPGNPYDSVTSLTNGTSGIHITGSAVFNGPDEWVPIRFLEVRAGHGRVSPVSRSANAICDRGPPRK